MKVLILKIIIVFNKMEYGSRDFEIKAQAVEKHGSYLITPSRYISKKPKYLIAHVLTAFASAFLRSKVEVLQTLFGRLPENSLKSSSYEAGSEAVKVVSDDIKQALLDSKDVAYKLSPNFLKLTFLESPKQ